MANGTLIKIDKNGTKYYRGLCTCDRCNGKGLFIVRVENGQGIPAQPDSGVCYKCGGSGKVMDTWKEYTAEHRAKLDAQNAKRAEKKQQEVAAANSAAWLENNGFAPDGLTYIFLGDTYAAKEQLKEAGAKFDYCIGWHAAQQIDGFYSLTVHVDEIAEKDAWGRYHFAVNKDEWDDKKAAAYKQLSVEKESSHFGNVGDKVELNVKLVRAAFFDGFMGNTTAIYTMKDAEGHLFIWKTTSCLERVENGEYHNIENGEHFTLKGTIKEHSEYKGEKQTVLTRCRVA